MQPLSWNQVGDRAQAICRDPDLRSWGEKKNLKGICYYLIFAEDDRWKESVAAYYDDDRLAFRVQLWFGDFRPLVQALFKKCFTVKQLYQDMTGHRELFADVDEAFAFAAEHFNVMENLQCQVFNQVFGIFTNDILQDENGNIIEGGPVQMPTEAQIRWAKGDAANFSIEEGAAYTYKQHFHKVAGLGLANMPGGATEARPQQHHVPTSATGSEAPQQHFPTNATGPGAQKRDAGLLEAAQHYGAQGQSKGAVSAGMSLIQDYMDDGKINLSNTAPTAGQQPSQSAGNDVFANIMRQIAACLGLQKRN